MAWENDLALEFKKRENKTPLGAVCGTVLSVNPVKISILSGSIILTEDKIYLCGVLSDQVKRPATIKLDSVAEHGAIVTDGEVTFKDVLKVNDKVLCLPADGEQRFFIIDKVV